MSHLSGSAPFPVKSCSYVTEAVGWEIEDFVSDVLWA